MKLYKTYMFRTKDPIIDAFRTAFSDSGMTKAQLVKESNVSAGTFNGWLGGKTRRPQFATMAASIRGLGADGITFGTNGAPRITGVRRAPPKHLKLVGSSK